MRKFLVYLACLILLVGGLSCFDFGKEDEDKPTATGTVRLYNNQVTTIWYFYMRTAGTSNWGSDRLGVYTVPQGSYFYIYNVPVGTYDFKVASSGGSSCAYLFGQSLPANSTLYLTANALGACSSGEVVEMNINIGPHDSATSDKAVDFNDPVESNVQKEKE